MSEHTGRAWSRFGFIFGIVTSVAANVAHSYLRPHPQLGAVISSAFWPVALLIAIEIISRVNWPEGRRWAITRYGGLTSVAAVAALVSYSHMNALLLSYGETWLTALLGPLAIDGLMVVSTAALLAIAGNVRKPKAMPIIGRVLEEAHNGNN